jgi:hypothetical protein
MPVRYRPVRLSIRMMLELLVRLALAGFLVWVGVINDDEEIVLALCGIAALYHLWVAFQLASISRGGATWLELDAEGLTFQKLWKRRHIPWRNVVSLTAQPHRLLSRHQPGLRVEIGDVRGPTGSLLIPDLFEPGPRALLAEMEQWRRGRVPPQS